MSAGRERATGLRHRSGAAARLRGVGSMLAVAALLGADARAEDTPTCGSKRVVPVTFAAADGLLVSADLYAPYSCDRPLILLFHQAGWSRGEYKEIAPRLQKLGFNALAVDQRAGGAVNGLRNLTHRRAQEGKLGTKYLDAYPDMLAALRFVRTKLKVPKVLLWGSSYSAALVLRLAAEHGQGVVAVLAFSPGEYFSRPGVPPGYVRQFVSRIKVPVFFTSAASEKARWRPLFKGVTAEGKAFYLPPKGGHHGSRALWKRSKGRLDYWRAVQGFLAAWQTPRDAATEHGPPAPPKRRKGSK